MFHNTQEISEALYNKSIEQAGSGFFYYLGHTTNLHDSICSSIDPLSFIYTDMNFKGMLTSEDRSILDKISSIAYLFDSELDYFRNETPNYIQYFSVDIENNVANRSQDAYEIHRVIAKATQFCSVVLFRHQEKYMLTFHYWYQDDKYSIFLSDWFDEDKEPFFELISASNLSDTSTIEFFTDLIYFASRDYYIYPLSKEYMKYIILPSERMIDEIPVYYRGDELNEIIIGLYKQLFFEYADDFIGNTITNLSENIMGEDIEEIDFDLLEYELKHSDSVDNEFTDIYDEEFFSDEDFTEGKNLTKHESEFSALDIDPDVLEDPLKLLEWLNKQD